MLLKNQITLKDKKSIGFIDMGITGVLIKSCSCTLMGAATTWEKDSESIEDEGILGYFNVHKCF